MRDALWKVAMRSIVAALLLASSFVPLRGATLERLSLDDMIQQSTAIVKGRVTGSYAATRGSLIYTHLKVQVEQRWKGPDESTVEVLIPGGTANGFRQTFSGAPQLTEGKEYLFFLWADKNGGNHIIGFTQGLFDLPKDGSGQILAFRPATSETMLDPATGRAIQDHPIQLRLRDLSARISTRLKIGARK